MFLKLQQFLKSLILIASMSCGLSASDQAASAALPVNGIAAQVEDRIITLAELHRKLGPLVVQIRRTTATRSEFNRRVAETARDILEQEIDRILILREFEKEELTIPQTFLDNAYDDYITETFGGDRSAFLDYIKSQGMTDIDFREDLKESMIVQHMRGQRIPDKASISPEKIKAFYERNRSLFAREEGVKLRMIVLRPQPGQPQELMGQRVQQVRSALADGTPFGEVAQRFSDGENADKGGDWGWVERGLLRDDLGGAAFALEPGTISEPLYLDDRVYILHVEERRDAGIKQLSQVRGEIEETIASRLATIETERWLDSLREDAFIMIHLSDVSSILPGNTPDNTIEMDHQSANESKAEAG